MNLIFGCCIGSYDKYLRYVDPFVRGSTRYELQDQTNIASAYNKCIERSDRYDALVLLHDDLMITDAFFAEKVEKAFADPDVVLLGVAGAHGIRGLDWWSYAPIGHQWLNDQLLDFGEREGEVDGIEGSIMVLSPWVIENLRFDESFGGFYGYDCDLPQQVVRAGKKVRVVDIDTVHHSQFGFKSPALEQQFHETNLQFRRKWNFV